MPAVTDPLGWPGATQPDVPLRYFRFGAVHQINAAHGLDFLMIQGLDALQVDAIEVYMPGAISDLVALPVPCRIVVGAGIFNLVLARAIDDDYEVAQLDIRPRNGFVVPAGIGFALQPDAPNRVTYARWSRRYHDISWRLPYDHPALIEAGVWHKDGLTRGLMSEPHYWQFCTDTPA
jgi:hypothetical protein